VVLVWDVLTYAHLEDIFQIRGQIWRPEDPLDDGHARLACNTGGRRVGLVKFAAARQTKISSATDTQRFGHNELEQLRSNQGHGCATIVRRGLLLANAVDFLHNELKFRRIVGQVADD